VIRCLLPLSLPTALVHTTFIRNSIELNDFRRLLDPIRWVLLRARQCFDVLPFELWATAGRPAHREAVNTLLKGHQGMVHLFMLLQGTKQC